MTNAVVLPSSTTPQSTALVDTPVVGAHNNYLAEQTTQIRARTIPWEGYQRAALISDTELAQIKLFEKSPATALDQDGQTYVALLLSLLSKLVRTDTIQNILVLIDDILTENISHINHFYSLAAEKGDLLFVYTPFLKMLKKDDEYIQLKAAKILVLMLSEAPIPPHFESVTDLVVFLTNHVSKNSNPMVVDLCVQFLQTLLSVTSFRLPFYQFPGALSAIVDQLKKATTAQMQYQLIYCLWLLTFEKEVAKNLQRKYDVLPCMMDIGKSAIKEKVIRIVVAVWKHMILSESQENLYAFVGNKVLAMVENLIGRKFTDTEISEDLVVIQDELNKTVTKLSTFDEYISELRSGKLEWSPVHLSEQFWKQNATRLNDQDYELLRVLSRVMSTSTNPIVLAVAAHDIGQYVKHFPSGRKIVQDIGAKTQVMELMTHDDADVRYQALLAVQKFMTNAWVN